MARKKTRRRKRRTHVSAAPRRRKRRMNASAPVIGSPRKRRRKHHMSGRKHKRRRMSGADISRPGAGEYIALVLGTGLGLTSAEIGTPAMYNTLGQPMTAGLKVLTSIGTYALAVGPLKNNGFVKGISIGLAGSAANDGFRALRGAGIMSGVSDVVIEIKDGQRKLKPGAQQQIEQPAQQMNGNYAQVMNAVGGWDHLPLNY
jgi:hypothetical protein